MIEKKTILQSDPYKRDINKQKDVRNVYWGEVVSIDDPTDGGRIRVRIADLDNKTPNENLPYAYPLIPKHFHIYPQVGEVVRIILEDVNYPQRSRFWMGSVISQPHKIGYDNIYTALSTTNLAVTAPEKAPSTYPEAKGVYPNIEDIALVGRENTDLILRERDVELRAGKHEYDNNLVLNKKNPASVRLLFEQISGKTQSSVVTMADKIAFISHEGIPKFKAAQIDEKEREEIFATGHPLGRGDVIVEALEILRKAIIQHIHPYSGLPSDKSGVIIDLEKIDFTQILQRNIVIN